MRYKEFQTETKRMSAAVKLQRAWDRERAKSDASRERMRRELELIAGKHKSDEPSDEWYDRHGNVDANGAFDAGGHYHMDRDLEEHGKASKELCQSSRPDADLGASNLASCKSQGLRARDGDKSHKLGKGPESRIKVGGHRIKGKKYGGPLPDWS